MKKLLALMLLLIPARGFCDTKISALPSTTTLNSTDIIPVVTGIGGTPTNKTITFNNFTNSMSSVTAGQVSVTGPGGTNVTYGLTAGSVTVTNSGADNPQLIFVDKTQSTPAGKYRILTNSDFLYFMARNAADNTNVPLMTISRFDNPSGGLFVLSSSGTKRMTLQFGADSGHFIGLVASQAANSNTYILPSSSGTVGQAIITDGNNNLSFGAVGGTPSTPIGSIQANIAGVFGSIPGSVVTLSSVTINVPVLISTLTVVSNPSPSSNSSIILASGTPTYGVYSNPDFMQIYNSASTRECLGFLQTIDDNSSNSPWAICRNGGSGGLDLGFKTVSGGWNGILNTSTNGSSPQGSTVTANAIFVTGQQIYDGTNTVVSAGDSQLQVTAANTRKYAAYISTASIGGWNVSIDTNGNTTLPNLIVNGSGNGLTTWTISQATYTQVSTSGTYTVGQAAIFSSTNGTVIGGSSGGGTPATPVKSIQYNQAGAFGAIPNSNVWASSVTVSTFGVLGGTGQTSNIGFNGTGGSGFLDVFLTGSATNRSLFDVGSSALADQFYVPNNHWVMATQGIQGAGLVLGDQNNFPNRMFSNGDNAAFVDLRQGSTVQIQAGTANGPGSVRILTGGGTDMADFTPTGNTLGTATSTTTIPGNLTSNYLTVSTSGTALSNFSVNGILTLGGSSGDAYINGGASGNSGVGNSMMATAGSGSSGPNLTSASGANACMGSSSCHALWNDTNTTAMGYQALLVASGTTNDSSFGENSAMNTTSGNNITAIGRGTLFNNITGSAGTALGKHACLNTGSDTALSNIICIGADSQVNASGTMAIGSVSEPITDVYMNSINTGASNGLPITFHAQDSGTGSNTTGGNFTIAAGRGTGTGTSGSVIVKISSTGVSGSTLNSAISVSSWTANGETTLNNFHYNVTGSTQPNLTVCGSGPSVIGTDTAFTITGGSGSNGCTATFSKPFTNTPTCTVSEETFSLVNALSYTVSATAITITETSLGTNKLDIVCIGHD
jgi:hypothetical protein